MLVPTIAKSSYQLAFGVTRHLLSDNVQPMSCSDATVCRDLPARLTAGVSAKMLQAGCLAYFARLGGADVIRQVLSLG